MKARKIIPLALAVSMLGTTAFGPVGAMAEDGAAGAASIDFEDGQFGFVGIDKTVNAAGDDSLLEVADFNGSKALKVTSQGKAVYVGIQADALLGDNAGNVASVDFTVGTENPDGKFGAVAGKIYAFLGEDLARNEADWSVYLESANPRTISYALPEGASFVPGSYIVFSLETDTQKDKGATPAILYLDDIAFKDADGNTLAVDTSAQYVSSSTGDDRSNLYAVTDAVEFADFTCTGDGWAQNGFDMPQEILDALVPGSVVEISYTSETGDLWLVMPAAAAGWMRVGVGNADGSGSDVAYINGSKNIAQVTYEQIAAVCGDDVSTWGATMQCESSGAWEVHSVKVGKAAIQPAVADAVEFAGFACKGDGWAQDGFEMPQEILDALVPGSVVEISYASDNGDIWLVMPDAAAGWMRVGQPSEDGSTESGIFDGSKAYITYEQIAALCGDDVSAWGARMQCEASGAWEVFGVKVGTKTELLPVKNPVAFADFACKGDGWAQNGFDMPQEIIDSLVPGSVVTISYTSESGDIWLVMPAAEAGWMRVGQGNLDGSGAAPAAYNGSTCQVTYEQIAAVCGDDVSTWGATMQCESSTAWEVFSVSVGQAQ